MKRYFIPVIAVTVLATMFSCKKDGQEKMPPAQPAGKKWVVTTVAGNGTASFVNGSVATATFHFPGDVAVDDNGTIYVTDMLNFSIRKIKNGGVSNVAGGSEAGIKDGTGTAAQFKNPYSVAIDGNGNLYTSDDGDSRIRKISPAREVTVYAGTETPGFADGNVNDARFGFGDYLVTDAAGNLFVSDAINNCIRKISLTGQVATIAGTITPGFRDGNTAEAQFSLPGGIAIDRIGNLYVADRGNFRIRKITPAGNVSTFAGSGIPGIADGNPESAKFTLDMHDLVVDALGNVFVADNDRIRKITTDGVVSTIAGSTSGFLDGEGELAKFSAPFGLAVDAKGDIYVADLNNHRIRKISFK